MPNEADYLRAVLADPDSDGPRLVYADWLDEQGQSARAEFIRVSIAAERLEEEVAAWAKVPGRAEDGGRMGESLARAQILRRREGQLLETVVPGHQLYTGHYHWCGHLLFWLWTQHRETDWHFRRGFVEAVTCTAADWLRRGDAILAAQPVQKVTLTTWPRVVQETERSFGHAARLEGRPTWYTLPFPWNLRDAPPDGWVMNALRAEWPSVKEWHLPPAESAYRREVRRAVTAIAERVNEACRGDNPPRMTTDPPR